MTGNERRSTILSMLRKSTAPLSGSALSSVLGVSRQIIVSDVALLRANGTDIISTNLGYILSGDEKEKRVFKVQHSEEDVKDELYTIVDSGGTVEDVFVYHKTYGIIKAEMNMSSRKEVDDYLKTISEGRSGFLMNITSGYHYHTVSAKDEAVLDLIQNELKAKGFLAHLQEFEPVDFKNRNR